VPDRIVNGSIFGKAGDVRYTKVQTTDPEEEVPPRGGEVTKRSKRSDDYSDPELCPEPDDKLQALEDKFLDLADKGELCVYTCLALRSGGARADDKFQGWEFVGTIIALIFLQIVVPALMFLHELSHAPSITDEATEIEFRIIGFITFLYSIRSMYNNALDECRSVFLEMAFEHNLPWAYVWPLVLGEFANSSLAASLCLTLFVVYCRTTYLPDLLINCLAINFLGNVDSEFCSADLRIFALDKFRDVVRNELNQHSSDAETLFRTIVERTLTSVLWLLRVGATLLFGTVLAFGFAMSRQAWICGNVSLPFIC